MQYGEGHCKHVCVNMDLSYKEEAAKGLFLVYGSSAGADSVESCSCSDSVVAAFPVLLCLMGWRAQCHQGKLLLLMVLLMVTSDGAPCCASTPPPG